MADKPGLDFDTLAYQGLVILVIVLAQYKKN